MHREIRYMADDITAQPVPLMLTEEQIAKNPAVDPKIVKEALQMRRELEKLGVWEDSGSRVSDPSLKLREKSKSRLITQNR